MLKQALIKSKIQRPKNDASSIGNKRRMARRAKIHGNKRLRQFLQKEDRMS